MVWVRPDGDKCGCVSCACCNFTPELVKADWYRRVTKQKLGQTQQQQDCSFCGLIMLASYRWDLRSTHLCAASMQC